MPTRSRLPAIQPLLIRLYLQAQRLKHIITTPLSTVHDRCLTNFQSIQSDYKKLIHVLRTCNLISKNHIYSCSEEFAASTMSQIFKLTSFDPQNSFIIYSDASIGWPSVNRSWEPLIGFFWSLYYLSNINVLALLTAISKGGLVRSPSHAATNMAITNIRQWGWSGRRGVPLVPITNGVVVFRYFKIVACQLEATFTPLRHHVISPHCQSEALHHISSHSRRRAAIPVEQKSLWIEKSLQKRGYARKCTKPSQRRII